MEEKGRTTSYPGSDPIHDQVIQLQHTCTCTATHSNIDEHVQLATP